MHHVHALNILHRDLKTANILLTSEGVIKLADFGIAKPMSSSSEMAKTMIGTPYYLSPEICEDKPYNHKSDIWSMGCVLYELATLQHPFEGNSLPALVLKIIRGRYRQIPPQYSKDLQCLIAKLLSNDPAARPDVSEILSMPLIKRALDAPNTFSLVNPADAGPLAPKPLAVNTPKSGIPASPKNPGSAGSAAIPKPSAAASVAVPKPSLPGSSSARRASASGSENGPSGSRASRPSSATPAGPDAARNRPNVAAHLGVEASGSQGAPPPVPPRAKASSQAPKDQAEILAKQGGSRERRNRAIDAAEAEKEQQSNQKPERSSSSTGKPGPERDTSSYFPVPASERDKHFIPEHEAEQLMNQRHRDSASRAQISEQPAAQAHRKQQEAHGREQEKGLKGLNLKLDQLERLEDENVEVLEERASSPPSARMSNEQDVGREDVLFNRAAANAAVSKAAPRSRGGEGHLDRIDNAAWMSNMNNWIGDIKNNLNLQKNGANKRRGEGREPITHRGATREDNTWGEEPPPAPDDADAPAGPNAVNSDAPRSLASKGIRPKPLSPRPGDHSSKATKPIGLKRPMWGQTNRNQGDVEQDVVEFEKYPNPLQEQKVKLASLAVERARLAGEIQASEATGVVREAKDNKGSKEREALQAKDKDPKGQNKRMSYSLQEAKALNQEHRSKVKAAKSKIGHLQANSPFSPRGETPKFTNAAVAGHAVSESRGGVMFTVQTNQANQARPPKHWIPEDNQQEPIVPAATAARDPINLLSDGNSSRQHKDPSSSNPGANRHTKETSNKDLDQSKKAPKPAAPKKSETPESSDQESAKSGGRKVARGQSLSEMIKQGRQARRESGLQQPTDIVVAADPPSVRPQFSATIPPRFDDQVVPAAAQYAVSQDPRHHSHEAIDAAHLINQHKDSLTAATFKPATNRAADFPPQRPPVDRNEVGLVGGDPRDSLETPALPGARKAPKDIRHLHSSPELTQLLGGHEETLSNQNLFGRASSAKALNQAQSQPYDRSSAPPGHLEEFREFGNAAIRSQKMREGRIESLAGDGQFYNLQAGQVSGSHAAAATQPGMNSSSGISGTDIPGSPDGQLRSRIERIRQKCEQVLGLETFLEVYQRMRDSKDNSGALPMELLDKLGDNMPIVRDVNHLISCEDKVYLQ